MFHEENESAGHASATAAYYVLADDHDMAIHNPRKAAEQGHPRAYIATDLDFAPLRGNSEFEALIADPDE